MAVEVGLAQSIEEQARLIESQAKCFFYRFLQLSPSSFKTFRFLYFCQVYKANLSHVLQVAQIAVCVNLL